MSEQTGNIDTSADASAEAPIDIKSAMEMALSGENLEAAQVDDKAQPSSDQPKTEEVDWSKFDLSKAPQEVREKLYKTFQPDLQKRIDDLSAAQTQLLERAVAAFESKNAAPAPPDLKAKLAEAIENNDLAAVAELSTAPIREELNSIKSTLTRQQALDAAVRADPTIPQNEAEIASRLKSNPALLEMASVAGNRFAPYVLQGINAAIRIERMSKEFEALKTNFNAAVETAVKKDRASRAALVERLGSSSTRAGGTVVQLRESPGEMNIREALSAGWDEAVAGRS